MVDVFGEQAYLGNPVAVVLGADGMGTEQMQRVAAWANLSETAFVVAPTRPEADYRVRIFTPGEELAFAGHPTLGSAHAWLAWRGTGVEDLEPGGEVVQECGVGLVPVRRTRSGLAFAAPPLVRSGAPAKALVAELAAQLGLSADDVVGAQWVDNGPGWVALELASAQDVLAVRCPVSLSHNLGLVGRWPPGWPTAYEVRAFFVKDAGGTVAEDPVTGSLNASLAQWLVGSGRFAAPYAVSQGSALGRGGVVHIDQDHGGRLWVGGSTLTCAHGRLVA